MRIGIGFDAHRFEEGRKLVLGGVHIPDETGLAGHSDADVLLHAICDALLGAVALGDIGQHFPPGDPSFKGISSLTLLRKTAEMVRDKGFEIVNVDSVVIAEKPRITPYVDSMRKAIALAMDLVISKVSVKGTTTEGMGFAGRKEGIAAQAVVSARPIS